jgi:hypothetical protein
VIGVSFAAWYYKPAFWYASALVQRFEGVCG